MDSITQIVLGAAIAGAIVPRQHRRAALLAGAALGTLPDMDSLPLALLTDNPVDLMTLHRSASHSLFVLPLLAALIWWLFKRGGGRVAQAPARWFWAIQLALVTHPLLDAFTVYGTQLWWPLRPHPAMWSSVFIIDPGYTIGLLLACIVAWWAPQSPRARQALVAGLAISSAYLGWSLWAKHLVDAQAQRDLAAMGLADAPRFSVPTPFNTLLWKVVAMTPRGYVIGERSVVADHGSMHFEDHPSNTQALAEVASLPVVRQLRWFNRGFMRAQVRGRELVLSDLRMGIEPDYTFSFVVAEAANGDWQPIAPRQPQSGYRAPVPEAGLKKALAGMWRRIWQPPPPPAADDQAAAATFAAPPAISASK